jgi:hypothetical protein
VKRFVQWKAASTNRWHLVGAPSIAEVAS